MTINICFFDPPWISCLRWRFLLSYSLSIRFPVPLWLLLNYLHFSFLQKISRDKSEPGRGGNVNVIYIHIHYVICYDICINVYSSQTAALLSCSLCFRSGYLGHSATQHRIECWIWFSFKWIIFANFPQMLPNLRRVYKLEDGIDVKVQKDRPLHFMSRLYLSLENEWSNLRYVINYFFEQWSRASICPLLALILLPSYHHQSQPHNKYNSQQGLFAVSWISIC